MMIGNVRFGSSLAFLVLAAITGLVGFFIVFHYASFERPTQRFAVVIDAGSTQTRSSLYSIAMQSPSALGVHESRTPLSDVIQVREVAGCVNGGPLAAIGSLDDANRLLAKCLPKFARKIRRLDFLITMLDANPVDDDPDDDDADRHLETEEVDRQMAVLNHRVNSVTHIHLGATAGMRALELLDPSKAEQKIHWMQSAVASSNANPLLAGGVFMNPGFIDIIEGTSEASFGWLSVNFACESLQIDTAQPEAGLAYDNDDQQHLDTTKYSLQLEQQMDVGSSKQQHQHQLAKLDSIGTLELGGASAQMAFQLAAATTKDGNAALVHNRSMQADSLELFGNNYHLATRSDLCLGMSQAILRTNYLLLLDHFQQYQPSNQHQPSNQQQPATVQPMPTRAEIDNPCQQAGSRLSLSSGLIDGILNGACLDASARRKSSGDDAKFKQFISFVWQQQQGAKGDELLQIVGSGRVDQCDRLLSKLVDPEECAKLFSLCPVSKNKQPPPSGMPFVTISGYNKALQVLNLTRVSEAPPYKQQGQEEPHRQSSKTEQVIEEKLGGYPIDYGEFEEKTRAFCSQPVREFPVRYPKMNKLFYDVNCLQMVYIRKLLTEFYQFTPGTGGSWSQVRFLLFPVGLQAAQSSSSTAPPAASGRSKKNDIGWTLGLLLNATSYELSAEHGGDSSHSHDMIYHHGASIQFIIRTTVFLMFACVFIAGSLIVCSMVLARRKHRAAYICHSDARADPELASSPTQPVNGL